MVLTRRRTYVRSSKSMMQAAVLTINFYISSAVRFALLILRCKKSKIKKKTERVNVASSVIENNYSASALSLCFFSVVAVFNTRLFSFDPFFG